MRSGPIRPHSSSADELFGRIGPLRIHGASHLRGCRVRGVRLQWTLRLRENLAPERPIPSRTGCARRRRTASPLGPPRPHGAYPPAPSSSFLLRPPLPALLFAPPFPPPPGPARAPFMDLPPRAVRPRARVLRGADLSSHPSPPPSSPSSSHPPAPPSSAPTRGGHPSIMSSVLVLLRPAPARSGVPYTNTVAAPPLPPHPSPLSPRAPVRHGRALIGPGLRSATPTAA
jgi:hypothetical protein